MNIRISGNKFKTHNPWNKSLENKSFQNYNKNISNNTSIITSVTVGTQTTIKSKINNEDEECCICFETNWVCKSECKHYICINCLIQIKKECPICRLDMSTSLPNALKPIVKMNKQPTQVLNSNLNIYDNSEFPHLF